MPIIEPVIRPPSESESFLLQVTTGCSSDLCTFCGAYKGKPFHKKDFCEIRADIEEESRLFPDTRRVFLMDGDALVISNKGLLPVLNKLDEAFPRLARISSYANGYNITERTDRELEELYQHKLSLIYIGLESGSQKILDLCKKRSTAEEMTQAVIRASCMGIKSSVIVLLGLGGRRGSRIHVEETINILNRMKPRYLSFLSLMLIPGTEKYRQARSGDFEPLEPLEMLKETRDILYGLDLSKTVFRADHASNFLSLKGRLSQDKEKLLDLLEQAISGKLSLRPSWLRGL